MAPKPLQNVSIAFEDVGPDEEDGNRLRLAAVIAEPDAPDVVNTEPVTNDVETHMCRLRCHIHISTLHIFAKAV